MQSQATKKATFVLVHPAWHGAWCWKKVIPLLRAHGHDVHAPTLTGLGERAHLAHPMVALDTHVQDVVNVLEFQKVPVDSPPTAELSARVASWIFWSWFREPLDFVSFLCFLLALYWLKRPETTGA